jgi:hypothetical protein
MNEHAGLRLTAVEEISILHPRIVVKSGLLQSVRVNRPSAVERQGLTALACECRPSWAAERRTPAAALGSWCEQAVQVDQSERLRLVPRLPTLPSDVCVGTSAPEGAALTRARGASPWRRGWLPHCGRIA